jgi:hypothetical protein
MSSQRRLILATDGSHRAIRIVEEPKADVPQTLTVESPGMSGAMASEASSGPPPLSSGAAS